MTDIVDLERRVTALEAAQKQTAETQTWMAATLGRIASVQDQHTKDIGELKEELYVLLNGRADVSRVDGNVIRSLYRGDVIGEMGLVRQRPRSADVMIAENTEYLVLDGRFVRRLRRQYPRIAATVFLNLARILSDRLESTTDQLVGNVRPGTRGRETGVGSPSRGGFQTRPYDKR